MDLLVVVYVLIYAAMVTMSVERLMGVFFERRRATRRAEIGSYIFYCFFICLVQLGFLSYLVYESDFSLIIAATANIIVTITYYLIALNYESTTRKRIIASLCIYLFISMSFGVVIFLLIAVAGGDLDAFATPSVISLYYLIAGLFIYVVATLLRKYKNIRRNEISSPVFWIASVIIPVLSLCITILIAVMLESANTFPLAVVVIFIILFVINVLTFHLQDTLSAAYEDKLKSTLHAQEKEYYFAQIQLMQESVRKVRSVRHDMNFHLTALKDFSVDNKVATDYIDSLLGDINESEIYSDTGNIAFDSVINFKLRDVLRDHIKLHIKIFIPPELSIEVTDVVTILGNLLDNAFDAVAKVEDKMVSLTVEAGKGNLFIRVDNTFDGVVQYADDAAGETKRIVSRKSGDEHGHGLNNIRKSVDKYDGHIDITHEGSIFSVGILMYVDGE